MQHQDQYYEGQVDQGQYMIPQHGAGGSQPSYAGHPEDQYQYAQPQYTQQAEHYSVPQQEQASYVVQPADGYMTGPVVTHEQNYASRRSASDANYRPMIKPLTFDPNNAITGEGPFGQVVMYPPVVYPIVPDPSTVMPPGTYTGRREYNMGDQYETNTRSTTKKKKGCC
eukprot:Selendium_serpulae@DN3182_c0_g1_i1.p1